MGDNQPTPSRDITPSGRRSRLRVVSGHQESLQIGGHCEEPRQSTSGSATPVRSVTLDGPRSVTPTKGIDWGDVSTDPVLLLKSKIPPAPVFFSEEKARARLNRESSPPLTASMMAGATPAKTYFLSEEESHEDLDWLSKVMSKPRHFKGTRPASWIGQMELYMDARRVPQKHRMTWRSHFLTKGSRTGSY